MLKIQIPNNNLPEREYIIKTLLTDFMGLEYSVTSVDGALDYTIQYRESKLVIRDKFFSLYPQPLSYLTKSSLPRKINYLYNEFLIEKNIPVLFGTDELLITENNIICGIDIFASSFFMLTRWEENVNMTRDKHNRFPGCASIANINYFLHRPVVNEYVEMLWNMLKKIGFTRDRARRSFELVLSHDIDGLTYVSLRSFIGDIIKRRNLKIVPRNFMYLVAKDPFDTYDFLMTSSEKLGIQSRFYFMSTDSMMMYDTSNYLKRKKFQTLIKDIKKRGHIIGFHPGYYTFNDPYRWEYEKHRLEKYIEQIVVEGRQHYLRMDITKTLPIWDRNNMEIDSTLGFHDKEGFRCGTGDEFQVFDFLNRKQLKLKERPLIIMDGTLHQSQNYSPEKVLEVINHYISIGRRYNTIITMLFHNSSFFGHWKGYYSIYKEALGI